MDKKERKNAKKNRRGSLNSGFCSLLVSCGNVRGLFFSISSRFLGKKSKNLKKKSKTDEKTKFKFKFTCQI
jgi:hypothetical protein